MKLLLVRHALTTYNLERRFLGTTDVAIAPEGAAQALALAKEVPVVDHIYISPLVRCRQTAALIWPTVPFTIVPELRENDFGPFEGKTHEELKDDEIYNLWLSYPEDPSVMPMVEDIVAFGKRASEALEIIVTHARVGGFRSVGIVSHGGTLMSMLVRHGRPEKDYYSWRMENCGGYIAELGLEPLTDLTLEVCGELPEGTAPVK